MTPRYKAVERSILGHACCFDASVVDTNIDPPPYAREAGDDWYGNQVVCECSGMGQAQVIANALNAKEDRA
jgi:hypothetical protein